MKRVAEEVDAAIATKKKKKQTPGVEGDDGSGKEKGEEEESWD